MAGLHHREPTPNELEIGINDIRRFYEDGRDKNAAERIHPSTLFQARQFAKTFKKSELNTLVTLMRKHRFLLCRRHIIRLLPVNPASFRKRLLSIVIKEHWNAPRLEAELRLHYGRQNKGPPPQPPEDEIALAFYLRRATNWWLRLQEVRPGLNLPDRAKDKMAAVWEAMSRLQEALEQWRPKTTNKKRSLSHPPPAV